MWSCQLCSASYISLRDLVSHVRGCHSEDVPLEFTCQVNHCAMAFHNTNSWYKHVVKKHGAEYKTHTAQDTTDESSEHEEDSCDQEGIAIDDLLQQVSSDPDDDLPPFSYDEAPQCISDKDIAGKLIRLKEKHNISHAAVDEVVQLVKIVCESTVSNALSKVVLLGEKYDMDMTSEYFKHLPESFNELLDPLADIGTVYRQQSYIVKNLPYVEPVWHEVGTHIGIKRRRKTPTNISDGFYYVPLLQSLEALLGNGSILHQILSGSHKCGGDLLFDICDGSISFNNPVLREDDQALQIIAYYDEFTLTNPLMSRAKKHKIGAIYFTLANIDPALRSRLEAINLVSLFNCSLLNNYSLDDILRPFIDDLNKLNKPSGWQVMINGKQYTFRGTLVAFVGDTPAISMVGGFKEGVGLAMRKCRQCMATYDQIQTKFAECEFHLRTKEEYAKHCEFIGRSGISDSEKRHFSKVYGINRCAAIIELPEFDVTQQLPQDLMHVLLEGIFPLHMEQLLEYIVETAGLMTLAEINARMAAFPYAYFNEKPAPLSGFGLQGNQSAVQMWELVNIFPFIISSCISLRNPHYACFMHLHELSSILFSPVIAKDQVSYLSILIKQYLEEFKALYPHRPLTPKCHYLVHIPAFIRRYGPLVHLWALRFEAKHKEFKTVARGSPFKNILLTLSHHHQRLLAYNLHFNSQFAEVTVSTSSACPITSLESLPYIDRLKTHHSQVLRKKLHRCQNVTILGTTYKVGQCSMMIGVVELMSGNAPQFGLLEDIIVYGEEPSILFIFTLMETLGYGASVGAYVVNSLAEYQCMYRSSISCYHLFNAIHHEGSNFKYVLSKYDLSVYCNYMN